MQIRLGIYATTKTACSQILELLRDLNECPELAPAHRYDLDITASSDKTRNGDSSSTDYDVPTARATLAEARQELKAGELTPIEYKRLEESILRNPAFAPAKGYLPLLSVPHSHVADTEGFSPTDESNVGFISTTQEEQYLRELDAYLAGETTTKRPSSYGSNVKSGERSVERDRDTALRNPVSVYNWLRKHQPQVFLQDKENDMEKTTNKASNARSSKRGSMQIKPDPEMYDDEGIALEPKSSRGKRKRGAGDDDGGYRPKGGGTRSAKRKRSEGGARNSKKFDTPG